MAVHLGQVPDKQLDPRLVGKCHTPGAHSLEDVVEQHDRQVKALFDRADDGLIACGRTENQPVDPPRQRQQS